MRLMLSSLPNGRSTSIPPFPRLEPAVAVKGSCVHREVPVAVGSSHTQQKRKTLKSGSTAQRRKVVTQTSVCLPPWGVWPAGGSRCSGLRASVASLSSFFVSLVWGWPGFLLCLCLRCFCGATTQGLPFSFYPIYACRRYWGRPLHPQNPFWPISSLVSTLSLFRFSWLC